MQKTMIQVPIISVIIPVYNSEQTVRRCIDFTQRIVGLAVREIWVCEKPKENGLLL